MKLAVISKSDGTIMGLAICSITHADGTIEEVTIRAESPDGSNELRSHVIDLPSHLENLAKNEMDRGLRHISDRMYLAIEQEKPSLRELSGRKSGRSAASEKE